MNTTVQSFRLAPMSPLIWMLTLALLAVPAVFFSTAMVGRHLLTVPALCVVVMYVWVWLRFRPTQFVVYPDRLEVHWPLKRRSGWPVGGIWLAVDPAWLAVDPAERDRPDVHLAHRWLRVDRARG